MSVNSDRLNIYLQSLEKDEDSFLEELRSLAESEEVPIIRKDMEDLMRFLMKLLRPAKVLEVGTAIGYSAIAMAKNLPESSCITTIEHDHKRAETARKNFVAADLDDKITLVEGDAGTVLETLEEKFDFVFMDAAKAQYITWLPSILKCLKPGGVLVTDNVLQEGDILESRFAVTRRNRTIHSRMREYLYTLKNTDGLITTILNVGDGAALTIKEN